MQNEQDNKLRDQVVEAITILTEKGYTDPEYEYCFRLVRARLSDLPAHKQLGPAVLDTLALTELVRDLESKVQEGVPNPKQSLALEYLWQMQNNVLIVSGENRNDHK